MADFPPPPVDTIGTSIGALGAALSSIKETLELTELADWANMGFKIREGS